MVTIHCDLCEEEIEDGSGISIEIENTDSGEEDYAWDTCQECIGKLVKFIESVPFKTVQEKEIK